MTERDQIEEKLKLAFNQFLTNDVYLLKQDTDERNLTFRLSMYLQQVFNDWNVDCEYNRNHQDIKQIKQIDNRNIRPDIIIHHRGTDDNLVIIEAKKSNNDENDIDKLKREKQQLKYKYAYKLTFFVGKELNKNCFENCFEEINNYGRS